MIIPKIIYCFEKNILHLFLSLLATSVFSQSLLKPIAASYIGLGAYSIHHVDVFSVNEQTRRRSRKLKLLQLVFMEKKDFYWQQTNMFSGIVAVPTKDGNFAFQADYFGFKNYNESQLGIAYARNVGNKLDLGIKFNYYSFRIPGFENPSTINFEIGAIVHLT